MSERGEVVAWMVTYMDTNGPVKVAYRHNAIADYRAFDSSAYSEPLVRQSDYLALMEEFAEVVRQRDEARESLPGGYVAYEQMVDIAIYVRDHAKGSMVDRVEEFLSTEHAEKIMRERSELNDMKARIGE